MRKNIEAFLFRRRPNGEPVIKVVTDKQVIDLADFFNKTFNYEFGYAGRLVNDTAYNLLKKYAGAEAASAHHTSLARKLGSIDQDKGGMITTDELKSRYKITPL